MDRKFAQLVLAISMTVSVSVANAAPYTISNGELVVNIRTDNGAIDDYSLNGVNFFSWGTHISDWGMQQGTDTTTFFLNTTNGGISQPVTVQQLSPTAVSVSGTYTRGSANVDFVRTLQIAPGENVLLVSYTLTNNDAVNPVEVAIFETFDPDQGVGSGCGDFRTYMDVVSVSPYIHGDAVDCNSVALVVGSFDSGITVASGSPFNISSGSTLNNFFAAPYDANGAYLDSGTHFGYRSTLPAGGTATFKAAVAASNAGASAAFTALINSLEGLLPSTSTINTNESGAVGEFSLALTSAPTSDVTVTLALSDATEGQFLTPPTYTFTPANWSVPQTIQVEGVDDQYSDGDKSYAISASWSSADPEYNGNNDVLVSVTNEDNESAGFNVSGAPFSTSEDGSTAQVTISLDSDVLGTITVPVSVSDTSEAALSTTQLVFDSSHLSQTITITGLDDGIADGDVPYLLQFGSAVISNSEDGGYAGMAFGSYNATNLDDDVAGFNVDTSMTGSTSETGRSTTFTMALTSEPVGNVTITFGVSDTAEATITPSITFTPTNWMTPQTVTITGLDDGTADGDKQYAITYQVVSADATYSGRAIPELDQLVLVNKENTDLQELEELTSNLTPASSNSGGGALNPLLLLAMGGLFLVRRRRTN